MARSSCLAVQPQLPVWRTAHSPWRPHQPVQLPATVRWAPVGLAHNCVGPAGCPILQGSSSSQGPCCDQQPNIYCEPRGNDATKSLCQWLGKEGLGLTWARLATLAS